MLILLLFLSGVWLENGGAHVLRYNINSNPVASNLDSFIQFSDQNKFVSSFHQVRGTQHEKGKPSTHGELLKFVNNTITRTLLATFGCTFCKASVGLLQELVAESSSEEEIRIQIERLCIYLGIEDARVCEGLSHEFKTEVLTVFDQLILRPNEVCALLLENCGTPYNPLDDWNVTLANRTKPPVVPPKLPKASSPTLRVLQLSDIHLDMLYKVGTNAECNEPLCCRPPDGQPAKGVPGAGKWGDYRNCDTTSWTLDNMFQHLVNISDQFDFVLWTGDLPPHNVWNQTRTDQLGILDTLTARFKKYLPNKMIFSALGNHESSPVNSFPPPFINGNESIDWLYEALAEDWTTWLPNSTIATIKQGGFYEVSPYPGYRIISINTNYCNNQNWWLLLNTTDPAGQLQWLIGALQQAEDNHEKVHIIGHIPPGISDCLRAWSWNYYKIVNRYESTIVGQFFGHTHGDHFEVFYDEKDFKRPTGVAYICPSVTTFPQLNPAFRIYTIDGNYTGSSWAVLDHETYIMNLTSANLYNKPEWKLEYSAKKDYGMPSLFPVDWNNLIDKMSTNNTLLYQFYRYYYKLRTDGSCDETCRKRVLCSLRSARSRDKNFCIY
ncbi:sphingomyelin phosphodiesterase [Patella vulgata]|uniref:sphingomyelin phosphodiesterase n=1 Tax=Patella vulgata TaxID=6465 RepID=UPI00217F5416|nr:sphingomyelin phosphodiesterase [Patella vulgata]XP_050417112.1 sphingomyelin phosphodiesterase [Patella vulgata]XP_055958670.1 sphingomyelin phosphodiesterase [Patella vulgata]